MAPKNRTGGSKECTGVRPGMDLKLVPPRSPSPEALWLAREEWGGEYQAKALKADRRPGRGTDPRLNGRWKGQKSSLAMLSEGLYPKPIGVQEGCRGGGLHSTSTITCLGRSRNTRIDASEPCGLGT